jgi:hypothetical protein
MLTQCLNGRHLSKLKALFLPSLCLSTLCPGLESPHILLPLWLLPSWQLLISCLPFLGLSDSTSAGPTLSARRNPSGSRKQIRSSHSQAPISQVSLNTVSIAPPTQLLLMQIHLLFFSFPFSTRVEPRAVCTADKNFIIELCSPALSVVFKESLAPYTRAA